MTIVNNTGLHIWVPKNWCFWTVVLEKTLESPLDYKEMKPINPKENQSWMFIGRTDAKAEVLTLWPPDAKSWLIGKDSDAGKDWRQEKKGMTEDKMVGWHPWLKGHEFEQSSGDAEGQGSLVQGVSKSRTWLSNWTKSTTPCCSCGGEALPADLRAPRSAPSTHLTTLLLQHACFSHCGQLFKDKN